MRPALLALSSLMMSIAVASAQTGFATRLSLAVPDTTLRVGDFNHDGRPDLLSYTSELDGGSLYFNDGNGGFGAPVPLYTTGTIGAIVTARVADLNGDGAPDIVACTFLDSPNLGAFYLVQFLNDGNGKFTIHQTTTIANCTSLVVGDVNLDGHPDVVIAYGTYATESKPASNTIQTFFGDGTGKVGNPFTVSNLSFDESSLPFHFNCLVDDLNGGNLFLDNQFSLFVSADCHPDIPTQNHFGTTFLAHGDGTGHFKTTFATSPNGSFISNQTVDLNSDGRPDGLFLTDTADDTGASAITEAINNGGGNFSFNDIATGNNFYGVTSADLNGDGIQDIAVIASTHPPATSGSLSGPQIISIYNGSKSSGFTRTQSWTEGDPLSSSSNIVSADFNGDGKPDLAAIITEQSQTSSTGSLYLFTNEMGSTGGTCKAPTTTNSNIICLPAKGITTPSPITVTAASNVSGFTLNRLYLDNTSVFQAASQSVTTSITAANGTHDLVLVSYNNGGKSFTTSTTFTVTTRPSSCLPATAGVSICAPTAGSTDLSPVTITAGALAGSGNITAIRAYIDNFAVFLVINPTAAKSQQVTQSVNVAAGTHKLVIVGYQSTGGSVTSSESFTIK